MSLATVAEADAINTEAAWVALSTAGKQNQLNIATVYLDAVYEWVGSIEDTAQAESWPRVGCDGTLTDSNGRDLGGIIPPAVIQACAYLANINLSTDIMNSSFQSVTSSTSIAGGDLIYERAKADTVETEKRYSAGSSSTSSSSNPISYTSDGIQRIAYVDALLKSLTSGSDQKQLLRY